MMNPSYANSSQADKSVQFLEKLIFTKNLKEFFNVGTLFIVNQFAYIQTSDFKGQIEQVGRENDKYIQDAINKSDIVVLAWGSQNRFFDRQKQILSMIDFSTKQVFETKKHPSRGSYNNFINELKNIS